MTPRSRTPRPTSPDTPLIIWTRSRADWATDRELIPANIRRFVKHLPCTEQIPVPLTAQAQQRLRRMLDDRPVDVICTSPKGVQMALRTRNLRTLLARARYWRTFGQVTYRLLLRLRLPARQAAECQSSEELGGWLEKNIETSIGLAVIRPKEPSFPLSSHLTRSGFRTIDLIVYRTLVGMTDPRGRPVTPAAGRRVKADTRVVVVFASPSAVSGFTKSASKARWPGNWRRTFVAVCIGETTAAAAAKHFRHTVVAKASTVKSLSKALQATLRNFPQTALLDC